MARLVRKDLRVLPARMELTERLDRREPLVRSVRRVLLVTMERLARKDLKVPLARMELTERRDLLVLRVT
jgi:hypothetical protein